eukprot:CAMPEP_0114243542 /NCGR_PEP_ID=MMETSP0058-20121206/10846_1 /TAXON_ID=36894 /ORGANISM="Pyramimonas parkeae, CCMP726" /LENGTH=396 /DNA_ID=CAMNT_0001356391 /DNA_START=69 /DNA_END=1259 /DNA_ORIENTATION=-
MAEKDVEGGTRSDGRLIQVAVGLALLSFFGVIVSIALTASQDFECTPIATDSSTNAEDANGGSTGGFLSLLEPYLPGIMAGKTRPKLILSTEPNWPPYAFINPQTGNNEGMATDLAKGMAKLCNFDVVITQTKWTECWVDQAAGQGLLNGDYHACMTYTHSKGARDRQMDFSHALLKNNQPAGLLVRLNDDGTPEIDGKHNLDGKKVVHVNGWTPDEDGLGFVLNECSGERFSGYEIFPSSTENPNDDALSKLLNGTADAMWVFVNQDKHYKNAGCDAGNPNKQSSSPDWDCAKWAGFGKKFAFIQTGMFSHAHNGTTFTVSKKGSGLNEIVNPCLDRFVETKEYYEMCVKHGLDYECFPNSYFPEEYFTRNAPVWELPTKDLQTKCEDGYCACPV